MLQRGKIVKITLLDRSTKQLKLVEFDDKGIYGEDVTIKENPLTYVPVTSILYVTFSNI